MKQICKRTHFFFFFFFFYHPYHQRRSLDKIDEQRASLEQLNVFAAWRQRFRSIRQVFQTIDILSLSILHSMTPLPPSSFSSHQQTPPHIMPQNRNRIKPSRQPRFAKNPMRKKERRKKKKVEPIHPHQTIFRHSYDLSSWCFKPITLSKRCFLANDGRILSF